MANGDTGVPGVDPDVPAPKAELVNPYPSRKDNPAPAPATPQEDKNLLRYVTPQVAPNEQYPDPNKTPEGQDRQKEVNEYQAALKQAIEDSQAIQKSISDTSTAVNAGLKKVFSDVEQLDKDRAQPPDLLPYQQRSQQDMNAHNQLIWKWPATLATLGILIAGFAGKRRSGTLSNYFLGSFLQAYSQGWQQRQKDMEAGWLHTNEQIYKENQQRLSLYRARIEDERFSLDTKVRLMTNLADQYKDASMQKAIATGNINNIRQALHDAERGLREFQKQSLESWKAAQYLTKQNHMDGYMQELANLYQEKYGYPPQTEADYSEMEQYLSKEEYFNEHTKLGGTDPKTGRILGPKLSKPLTTPTPGASPGNATQSATPSATPDDAARRAAIKKFMEENTPQ